MLSETLAAGLGQYEIGAKIRALRQQKKLGLVQLGEHTGLSPAMLSKIERGQLIPTLPTLLRIALVFGVGLDHFFAETPDRPKIAVVRKSERLRLPDRPGEGEPSYFFESLDFPVTDRKLQAFYAEFPASSKESKPHQHSGAELIYVLKGQLALSIAGTEFALDEGDAIYFDSGAPHSYRCGKSTPCSAIVVTAP
ncbi:transcriptional regulator with XRE-family HTH domain [Microvirga flocculans]|uniref:Transcriptional regulator with XRE-family HTH domain n=1 Tax=Microvirga flocculans TaxID=217168 RepID=A0A7W6IIH8_9HYPH|nr:cupin domain-containing protein [Microvirga flocculans]MBB4042087.1 transcriptional regulator with XRE-family HTH domain [Microvirga flocculans]